MQTALFPSIRRQLHQNPELSGQEKATARTIEAALDAFHPAKIIRSVGGHGILAEFFFSESGPTVLFRADMDAVAVQEPGDLVPYGSLNPGVAHKCGHDGHTTILLRLAQLLHEKPLTRGRVLLLFQPAEENGSGSSAVLADLVLQQYDIQQVFALHNIPGIKESTVLCRPGSFTCAVISASITLTGQPSHAAEPGKGISPVPATLKITEKILDWNCYDITREDYFLATIVEIHVGEEAYGVAAGNSIIRVTLRAKTNRQLLEHMQQLEKLVTEECSHTRGLVHQLSWVEPFPACENDYRSADMVKTATLASGMEYTEIPVPFSWGEDFGLFTQKYKGAMFGLGAGEQCPPLHSPLYDFPDSLIETGANLFRTIAELAIDN